VENYIRKIAFCRKPLPQPVVFVKRGYRFLKRLIGGGSNAGAAPGMFQNS
jgi:hypothetical protein